jgi:hypothetical protein
MADSSYLVDSNVLLRWVQPSSPDYQLTTSAVDSLVSQNVALCYTSSERGRILECLYAPC